MNGTCDLFFVPNYYNVLMNLWQLHNQQDECEYGTFMEGVSGVSALEQSEVKFGILKNSVVSIILERPFLDILISMNKT